MSKIQKLALDCIKQIKGKLNTSPENLKVIVAYEKELAGIEDDTRIIEIFLKLKKEYFTNNFCSFFQKNNLAIQNSINDFVEKASLELKLYNLLNFPIEIILNILNYLSAPDLSKTAQVCSFFYGIKNSIPIPPLARFKIAHKDTISTAIKLNRNTIVLGFFDGTVAIYDLISSSLQIFSYHNDAINALHLLDNERLLVASSDGFVTLIDLKHKKLIRKFGESEYINTCLAMLNNNELMVGSSQKTIIVFNINSGEKIRLIEACDEKFKYFLPQAIYQLNDKKMLVCGHNHQIYLFDKLAGKKILSFVGHTDIVKATIIFGKIMVSASTDKTIRLWNIDTGKCIKVLKGHTGAINCLAKINASQFVTGACDGTVRLWDINSDNCLNIFCGTKEPVTSLIQLRDRQILATSRNQMLGWHLPDHPLKIENIPKNQV